MDKKMYFELGEKFKDYINDTLKDKKILNYRMIPTGWTNIVYEVETNDGNYFFRFPRDEFWSRTIVKDYKFAKFINGKTKYQTCDLKLFYNNGRPFSVHKKIEGTPLAEKMNNLSDEEINKVSSQISEFMNDMHKIDCKKVNEIDDDNISTKLSEFLDELLKVHVSDDDIKFWNKDAIENEEMCFVHGDLNSSNVLLDENNNVKAIIDFGFGGYGNKYNDIARIIGRCPTKFKNSIIDSYEKISNQKIDEKYLNTNIDTWTNIDNAYINYMRKIGIYN